MYHSKDSFHFYNMQECTQSINRLIFCNLYSFLQVFGGYFVAECRFLEVIFVSNADFRRFLSRQTAPTLMCPFLQKHRQIQRHRYLIVNHTDIRHAKFVAFFNALPHKHGIERLRPAFFRLHLQRQRTSPMC